ncbi:unnamed protein product [Arabidopsis thaliana]|uniref:Uncharacterized protein n=1 Tax=Arabidopsis thaliana TaxID=3702 RepID=A0A5S9XQ04_ARATH|nr:unnamed protein product [Arabidopsis thaliana]
MENGGAESSNGKEEQLESEISKKLEITKMVKRRTMEKKEAKPKNRNTPCIVEEGENRLLTGGLLQGDARLALFRLEEPQPSTVRGIPDVSINLDPKSVECPLESLELDLAHYEVPAPTPSANSYLVYAADNAENPRSLSASGSFNDSTPKAAQRNSEDSGVTVDGSPSAKITA